MKIDKEITDAFIASCVLLNSEAAAVMCGLDTIPFQALLGMMIDTHCKRTGEDAVAIAKELLEVVTLVNEKLGPFGKEEVWSIEPERS